MRQAMMIVGIVTAASVTLGTAAAGQGGQGSANSQAVQIIGLGGTLTPIVGDLEEAARFYSGLAGLESPPPILRRSHRDVPYPEVLKNQGTPDATIRQINLKIPNSTWSLEVLEFSELDRKAVSVRPQDPGALTLVLSVRDVDGLLATLKRGTIRVVTPGGQPVPLMSGATKARAVLIKTADGHFVELQQPDPLPADAFLVGLVDRPQLVRHLAVERGLEIIEREVDRDNQRRVARFELRYAGCPRRRVGIPTASAAAKNERRKKAN